MSGSAPKLVARGTNGASAHARTRRSRARTDRPMIAFADPALLRGASSAQLVRALQDETTRLQAQVEINLRLPENKINRVFFWLVYAFLTQDDELGGKAYEELRRLAIRYLNRHHRPLIKMNMPKKAMEDDEGSSADSSSGFDPHVRLPDWDELIHHTLFGSQTVTGAVEQACNLTPDELLENALRNMYSGILNRMAQRHKDQLRASRFERPLARGSSRQVQSQDVSESVIGLEPSGAPIYDRATWLENLPDPTFGRPNIGTGGNTEYLFMAPIALIQWHDKNQQIIATEVGETAKEALAFIIEGLASGSLNFHGLTVAGTRKVLIEWLVQKQKINKRQAARRISALCKSDALKKYLLDAACYAARFQPAAPRHITVAESKRKKIGCEHFYQPDKRRTPPHAQAE